MNKYNVSGPVIAIPGAHFRYLYWGAIVAITTAILVAAASFLIAGSNLLYRENGVLEDCSLIFWVASCLISAGAAVRFGSGNSRVIAIWTGWIAALAAMRELDLHIWLNPQRLGEYGVRYRIDWWLDGGVNIWLKLCWATIFIIATFLTFYAPTKLRKPLIRLARTGDSFIGLLAVSVVFLACGFVVDDILRPVHVVSLGTKQLIEETSELIGAALFCLAIFLHWRYPLTVRIRE